MNECRDNYMNMANIISSVLGMMNLQENLTQGDKQDILDDLNKESDVLLSEKSIDTYKDKIKRLIKF